MPQIKICDNIYCSLENVLGSDDVKADTPWVNTGHCSSLAKTLLIFSINFKCWWHHRVRPGYQSTSGGGGGGGRAMPLNSQSGWYVLNTELSKYGFLLWFTEMNDLGESLACGTQNSPLFPLGHVWILVSSLSFHLGSHGPYDVFRGHSQISYLTTHLCKYSQQLTCQKRMLFPHLKVLGAALLPSACHYMGRGWRAQSSAGLPVPRWAPASSLTFWKEQTLSSVVYASPSDTIGRCFSSPKPSCVHQSFTKFRQAR